MVNRVACPRIRPKLFSLTVKKFLYLVVAGSLLVLFCRATVWNNGEADWSRNASSILKVVSAVEQKGFVTSASQLVIRSPVPRNVRLYSSVETQTSTHVSVRRSEHNMKGPSNDSLQTDDAKDVNANDIESMLRSHNPNSPGIDEIIRRHKNICLNIDSGNDQISEYYSNMIKNHLEAWHKFVPTVDRMGPKNCWCMNHYRVPSSRVQRLLSHWVNLDSVSKHYSILQAQSIVRSVQNEERHKTSFSSVGVRKCHSLFCLPEVYLIGFPTCGTTALYSYLTMNASAGIRWVKEGQFWRGFAHVKEGHENNIYLQLDVLHYIHLYKRIAQKIAANSKTRLIDASATTSYDFAEFGVDPTKDTCFIPALLSRVLPNVKIIVIMREPVSRLWSQYWSYCSQLWPRSENDQVQVPNEFAKAPAEIFHNHSLSVVKKFLECSRENSEFDCLKFTRGEACTQPRLSVSLYCFHITKWVSVFPREQFYFLRIEDMNRDLYSEMKDIWNFLNTKVLSEEEFMSALEHSKLDQNANMWIKSEQYKDSFQMWPETKQLLGSFFQPYNERLARLLDDDKYLWHDV